LLHNKRNQVLDYRNRLGEAWRDLHEWEPESVRNDGRIEMEELEVAVDRGRVTLGGSLPNETKHRILVQILEGNLGVRNIVDRVSIDRHLWERRTGRWGK
jgi:hypothetical protein